jgi:TolB-like protein
VDVGSRVLFEHVHTLTTRRAVDKVRMTVEIVQDSARLHVFADQQRGVAVDQLKPKSARFTSHISHHQGEHTNHQARL